MAATRTFVLNEAIAAWRAEAAQQPALGAEALDELESHLRDSVERLEASGLDTEEAFLIATRRVGAPQAIGREFAKVNPQLVWIDRALWMLIGVTIWGPLSAFFTSLGTAAIVAVYAGRPYYAGTGILGPATAFTVAHVAGFALSLAVCVWLVVGRGPRFITWLSPRLQHRWTFVWVGLFLSFATITVSMTGRMLFAMRGWPEGAIDAFGLASSFVQLLQVITLVSFTLWLVRRRAAAVGD